MYRLLIHADAESDLESIYTADPDSAAFLLVFLQELEGDQYLLSRLNEHGFSVRAEEDWVGNIDIQRWVSQWNVGKNLWRLKSWELEDDGFKYRIVYAFQPTSNTYHVLGIFHRSDFDYEPNSPLTTRILSAYADL